MGLVDEIMEGKRDSNLELLEEFLACQTVCADISPVKVTKLDVDALDIDKLIAALPGLEYVKERMLNYIFSNGLTTGDEAQDEKLEEFLYERKNRRGSTNYSVLREVIGEASIKGECGLRLYDGNLYSYPKGTFGDLVYSEQGIDEVVSYFIRSDGKEVDDNINLEDVASVYDLEQYFSNNGYILISTDEFINIRNDTGLLHGYSPFKRDKLRLRLLLSVYERLNYDIDYDGPGRIILRPKDGYITGDDSEVSTGEILNYAAKERRIEKAKREVERVGRQIKQSSSDSVILLSNAFDERIEHLPRVTKATEFFGWIEQEGLIIAQILGMSPTLLESGELHGNVSMEKIIDNAMLNTIVPKREAFAIQFSEMIARHLKVSKVYFNKYDLQQIQSENDEREKIASIIRDLSTAKRNSESEEIGRLIDEFADYLRSSLYTETGNLIGF